MSTCKSRDHMRNVESIGPRVCWQSQDVLPKNSSYRNSILTPDPLLIRKMTISLMISKLQVCKFPFCHLTSQQLQISTPPPSPGAIPQSRPPSVLDPDHGRETARRGPSTRPPRCRADVNDVKRQKDDGK